MAATTPLPATSNLPTRYLTPEDLASLMAVPLETVYTWRKRHTGPPGFRVGKHLRYHPAEVQQWVHDLTETAA